MKTARTWMSIFVAVAAVCVRADDVLPMRLNFDRYQPILNSTLFSLPTTQPSLTAHLYIKSAQRSCGITRFNLSDGREIVISPPPIDDNAIMYPTLPPKLPK